MLNPVFTFRRRRISRLPKTRVDRRSGEPARREPAPMPRMRWYA